jgi:hypothetical protein
VAAVAALELLGRTMRAITTFCLVGLVLVGYVCAQTFSATNKVDRIQAARVASRLSVGMREEDAEKLLAQSGLTNSLKLGCSHGWASVFILSDGCQLALDVAPKQARADGLWAGGLLRAADIKSNGVTIVSITLTNAP